MIITKEEMGISYLMRATQGEWEFTQIYSKNIPLDRIESHFAIESTIRYEKFIGESEQTIENRFLGGNNNG